MKLKLYCLAEMANQTLSTKTREIMQKIDFISFQCDGNGPATLGDSTKKINPLISLVSENIIGLWDPTQEPCSYKHYIQNVRYPGNKYTPQVKKQQEEAIGRFLEDLKTFQHPSYKAAQELYENLAKNHIDPDTQSVSFAPPQALVQLLAAMQKTCPFAFTLRTFGPDGPVIAEEIHKKFPNMTIERQAEFSQLGLSLSSEQTALKGKELFQTLLSGHILGHDNFAEWSQNNKKASFGKRVYCVQDALFEGKTVVTIFLDDNLKKQPRDTQEHLPANPDEENIAFPIDIYNRPTSWQDKGLIGIRVNPVKAATNDHYLIDKINKELKKRCFAPLPTAQDEAQWQRIKRTLDGAHFGTYVPEFSDNDSLCNKIVQAEAYARRYRLAVCQRYVLPLAQHLMQIDPIESLGIFFTMGSDYCGELEPDNKHIEKRLMGYLAQSEPSLSEWKYLSDYCQQLKQLSCDTAAFTPWHANMLIEIEKALTTDAITPKKPRLH